MSASEAAPAAAPAPAADAQIPAGAEVQVISKNEKKARKLIKEAGVKAVPGVNRVVLRRRGGSSFVIENPDVYRTPNGAYIVFGEAHVQQQDFAQQLAALGGAAGPEAAAAQAATQSDKSPEAITADLEAAVKNASLDDGAAADEDDEDVDAGDIDPSRIEMIQQQANVSRGKAIKALRENNGDLVNALMSLST